MRNFVSIIVIRCAIRPCRNLHVLREVRNVLMNRAFHQFAIASLDEGLTAYTYEESVTG